MCFTPVHPDKNNPAHTSLRRQALHGDVHASITELLHCLEVECQAVKAAVASGKQLVHLGGRQGVEAAINAAEGLLTEIRVSGLGGHAGIILMVGGRSQNQTLSGNDVIRVIIRWLHPCRI